MQTDPATARGIGRQVSDRNPGIDLLRGLAIVLVVFNHLGLRIPLKQTMLADVLPAWFLSRLNYNGYEAVFVFFVISGFLIAGNALRRWGSLERIDLRAFYARRFARIVPCLLALIAVLSVLHLLAVPDYTINRAGQSLPAAIWSALGLHLNWYEGHTGYLRCRCRGRMPPCAVTRSGRRKPTCPACRRSPLVCSARCWRRPGGCRHGAPASCWDGLARPASWRQRSMAR